MQILPRSAWTSTDPGWWREPDPIVKPEGIAVHWPASGVIGTRKADVAAALRGWRNYHVNTRGWADIGYNYAIDQAGRVWTLAGKRTAAHAASKANRKANARLYGVLFAVGQGEALSDAAKAAFRELRAELGSRLPVMGHQDVPGASTACPGPSVMAALRAGDLTGRATTAPTPTPPASGGSSTITTSRDGWKMKRLDLTSAHRKPVRGKAAGKLQALLLLHGAPAKGLVGDDGRPDRSAGVVTRRRLGEFQEKHNTGDGKGNADYKAGPATWSELIEG